jgi:hypothetical protein
MTVYFSSGTLDVRLACGPRPEGFTCVNGVL